MNNHKILNELEQLNQNLKNICWQISCCQDEFRSIAQLADVVRGALIILSIYKIFSWLFYFD